MYLPFSCCSLLRTGIRRAMSLVELLVCMAVIALMVGLSAPSISSLAGSRRLDMAGNTVLALAHQARQNALSKNALTALVIATRVADSSYDGRLVCVAELSPGSPQWTLVVPWTILPEGIGVEPAASERFLRCPQVSPALSGLMFRGAQPQDIVYQVFSPQGGLCVGDNGQPSLSPVLRFAQDSGNFYEISLNLYTGIPRVERP